VNVLDLAVLAAATWRLASLFTYESGPGRIFERLRSLTGIRHNDKGRAEAMPDGFWTELLSCVWCISPYIGAALTVLYFLSGSVIVWLCLPLALSALAVWMNRQVR